MVAGKKTGGSDVPDVNCCPECRREMRGKHNIYKFNGMRPLKRG